VQCAKRAVWNKPVLNKPPKGQVVAGGPKKIKKIEIEVGKKE